MAVMLAMVALALLLVMVGLVAEAVYQLVFVVASLTSLGAAVMGALVVLAALLLGVLARPLIVVLLREEEAAQGTQIQEALVFRQGPAELWVVAPVAVAPLRPCRVRVAVAAMGLAVAVAVAVVVVVLLSPRIQETRVTLQHRLHILVIPYLLGHRTQLR